MAEHRIRLSWEKGDASFTYETYSRNHAVLFKNGQETLIVSGARAYRGDADKADPEDLLVAALSSCHMLSFLAICAKKKRTVTSYEDEAAGFLENDTSEGKPGKLWVARAILRPKVAWDGDAETLAHIHHLAHQACFIAHSVKTAVTIEPQA